MSPGLARILFLLCGLCLSLVLLVVWVVTPAPPAEPPRPQVAPAPRQLFPPLTLPPGNDPPSVALRASLRNGERIYQQLCYNCHGRQGKGDGNDYMASIGHKPADHTDFEGMQKLTDWEFFVALRDGVKDDRGWLTMPPWQSVLTAQEMWDVIRYVRRLAKTAPE